MIKQTRWRAVSKFEPWDPSQKAMTSYCGLPGGYCNTYYDQEPNITNLMGASMSGNITVQGSAMGVANITEVPEAYGTIPGVYGVSGGANFAVAEIQNVPEAYGTIPGVYGPLGAETVKVVPGAYGRRPGIYDRNQHLEILLSGAMGLGAEATSSTTASTTAPTTAPKPMSKPMSTAKKILWLSGALAAGAAAGVVGFSLLKGR